MELLNKILDALKALDGAALAMVAVVIEFALRLVKSQKPLSLLHGLSASLKVVAAISSKAAELLDKVLPQRLK